MCLYPKFIKNKKYTPTKKNGGNVPICHDYRALYVPVGCGKCIECRKQKARNWQVRLYEELKTNKKAYFVTLTFTNEDLKQLEKECKSNDANTIATIAVRRFTERYRKLYKKTIRHWLITELGQTETERIHLHGIIWTNHIEELQTLWKYGRTDVGTYCNNRTINYIVKYVTKLDIKHKNFEPKIFASKGIGKEFMNKDGKRIIYRGKETHDYYTTDTGHKIQLPIYYRNKAYSEEEREKLWLEKLDQERIFIMGNEYPTHGTKNKEIIDKVRKTAQKRNIDMGYGDNSKKWQKAKYNNAFTQINK